MGNRYIGKGEGRNVGVEVAKYICMHKHVVRFLKYSVTVKKDVQSTNNFANGYCADDMAYIVQNLLVLAFLLLNKSGFE